MKDEKMVYTPSIRMPLNRTFKIPLKMLFLFSRSSHALYEPTKCPAMGPRNLGSQARFAHVIFFFFLILYGMCQEFHKISLLQVGRDSQSHTTLSKSKYKKNRNNTFVKICISLQLYESGGEFPPK